MKKPSFEFFYTIHSNSDGSACAEFHADQASAQYACDKEKENGTPFGDNVPRRKCVDVTDEGFFAIGDDIVYGARNPDGGLKLDFFYTIHGNGDGDGSACVDFHGDNDTAHFAWADADDASFCDGGVWDLTLEFNKHGKLLNPSPSFALEDEEELSSPQKSSKRAPSSKK